MPAFINLQSLCTGEAFVTVKALITAVNKYALKEGFAVVKHQSNEKKEVVTRVYLQCNKGATHSQHLRRSDEVISAC